MQEAKPLAQGQAIEGLKEGLRGAPLPHKEVPPLGALRRSRPGARPSSSTCILLPAQPWGPERGLATWPQGFSLRGAVVRGGWSGGSSGRSLCWKNKTKHLWRRRNARGPLFPHLWPLTASSAQRAGASALLEQRIRKAGTGRKGYWTQRAAWPSCPPAPHPDSSPQSH